MSSRLDAPAESLVLRAIAEPHRRRILQALKQATNCCGGAGPGMCECDLQEELGISQPTVSHHLAVLRRAGLIASERRGHWIWHYRLDGHIEELLRALREQL